MISCIGRDKNTTAITSINNVKLTMITTSWEIRLCSIILTRIYVHCFIFSFQHYLYPPVANALISTLKCQIYLGLVWNISKVISEVVNRYFCRHNGNISFTQVEYTLFLFCPLLSYSAKEQYTEVAAYRYSTKILVDGDTDLQPHLFTTE